ncbi:nucleotide exchange factor GrpE [Pseudaquidulcibacter saccharophilus]|uniref:nucleotide exchange factor GrpE n=1 Tax=Pseudaquidulcibacter saccharophilus TaxID=2831900 RepID=UPI001EFF404E|nr:nucleotide exchange factor GrpE [Pseudaquidulcibacter saccharophilus]
MSEQEKSEIENEEALNVEDNEVCLSADDADTETAQATGKSLEEELEAARAEIAGLKDAALRALAESENVRRRAEKEKSDARAYGIEKFARDLLPIADTLGRALGAITDDQRADGSFTSFVEGIELTEKELFAVLERNNVQKVGIQGEKFDPNLHQAVAQIPSAIQKDHIAEVFQPGFTLNGRVLRAAMVAVSAGEAN